MEFYIAQDHVLKFAKVIGFQTGAEVFQIMASSYLNWKPH
jgi:hypothetical protein